MKPIKYKVQKESLEDMCRAGRYNPSLEITFQDKSGAHIVKVGAGYTDDLYVYQSMGEETYILSQNNHFDYVGLEVFEGDEQVWEMFLQNDWQIQEVLGKKGLDAAPYNIIKSMLNHW